MTSPHSKSVETDADDGWMDGWMTHGDGGVQKTHENSSVSVGDADTLSTLKTEVALEVIYFNKSYCLGCFGYTEPSL